MSDLEDRPAEDASSETHRLRIQAAVEQYVQSLKDYADKLWDLYKPQTLVWRGVCTSLNTAGKTAAVTLDPLPRGVTVPNVPADWGRKTWTAGQIVNKQVRVLIDSESKRMWIDDVLE